MYFATLAFFIDKKVALHTPTNDVLGALTMQEHLIKSFFIAKDFCDRMEQYGKASLPAMSCKDYCNVLKYILLLQPSQLGISSLLQPNHLNMLAEVEKNKNASNVHNSKQ